MSLDLYDKALERKLSDIFGNVIMAPPDDAFTRSNESGKVKLPLISAYRMSNPVNFEFYNGHEVFVGRRTAKYEENHLMTKGLPVIITYEIDIWAALRDEADGIFRELVMYLILHPNIEVEVPNMGVEEFALKLVDSDTATDYSSFKETNIIHRYTLTYEVDNARLFYQYEGNKFIKELDIKISMGGKEDE